MMVTMMLPMTVVAGSGSGVRKSTRMWAVEHNYDSHTLFNKVRTQLSISVCVSVFVCRTGSCLVVVRRGCASAVVDGEAVEKPPHSTCGPDHHCRTGDTTRRHSDTYP